MVKPGGLLVYNSRSYRWSRRGLTSASSPVPANDIAEELGNVRQANVVLLGAYLVATNMLPSEAVETALDRHLGERQRKFLAS